jgi:hypothetical protein
LPTPGRAPSDDGVAKQVAGLDLDRERDILKWIESVSEFDAAATR